MFVATLRCCVYRLISCRYHVCMCADRMVADLNQPPGQQAPVAGPLAGSVGSVKPKRASNPSGTPPRSTATPPLAVGGGIASTSVAAGAGAKVPSILAGSQAPASHGGSTVPSTQNSRPPSVGSRA